MQNGRSEGNSGICRCFPCPTAYHRTSEGAFRPEHKAWIFRTNIIFAVRVSLFSPFIILYAVCTFFTIPFLWEYAFYYTSKFAGRSLRAPNAYKIASTVRRDASPSPYGFAACAIF